MQDLTLPITLCSVTNFFRQSTNNKPYLKYFNYAFEFTGSVIKIIKPTTIQANKNHQTLTNNKNSANSNLNQTKLKSIVPKVGQVIAGGKAIFIPTPKPMLSKQDSVKLVQPHRSQIEEPKAVITIQKKNEVTQATAHPTSSSGLNLGSMFLENVEKSVDSDYSSPPDSPFTIELGDGIAETSKSKTAGQRDNSSTKVRTETCFFFWRGGGDEWCEG